MIRNATKGTLLCRSYETADSPWAKTKGLMFRKGLPEGHGLLMRFPEGCVPGIWMLGMRFPIDIVFIDSQNEVVGIIDNAQPIGLSWRTWKVFRPSVPSRIVLELPAGTVRKTRTLAGDKIDIAD